MDIVTQFQRLGHVEIRKSLLTIGLMVTTIVVFQCFSLLYGNSLFLSPANNASIAMMVSNASVVNNSASTKVSVTVNDDKEKVKMDLDPTLALLYDSLQEYEDGNSQEQSMVEKGVTNGNSLIVEHVSSTDNSSNETKAGEIEHRQLDRVVKVDNIYNIGDDQKVTTGLALGVQNTSLLGNFTTDVESLNTNSRTSESVSTENLSTVDNAKQTIKTQSNNSELSPVISRIPNHNLTAPNISISRRRKRLPTSVSQMNLLLHQSHVSSHSVRPRLSSVRDRELLSAKLEIENAPVLRNIPQLYASLFRNVSMFKRSYELMESIFKVYIYKEGEKPIFHQPIMRGIYASEGWFMKLIEGNRKLTVRDPRKAHLFYLPFSAYMLRMALFGQNFQNRRDLRKHLENYVELIARKYGFWNRTGGADHFLVACHDWAPKFTRSHMRNCIRAVCNADVTKGFKIGIDTTLPVTYVHSVNAPLAELGGKPALERSTLAFFAGSMHGYLRPILLQFWENKEADMKIFGPLPRDIKGKRIYREYMKSSKYCICARGYEVHTPRVVEAIFYECVPVIISDNYVPPFFEVLNWEAFSIFVRERDIPNLRNILLSIPEERYLAMQARVKMVQKHFLWHKKPESMTYSI